MELSAQAQEFDDETLFTDQQTAILDLYYDCVYIQSSAYSDDAFKMNEALKHLGDLLTEMPRNDQKFDAKRAYFT